MGMGLNLLRIPEEKLAEILEDSGVLEDMLNDDDLYDTSDDTLTDLDKAWDGVQFILTGQNFMGATAAEGAGRAIFTGQIVDEEQDLGYGPGFYLMPDQVKDVNNDLQQIDQEEVKRRYDPAKMTEIKVYPDIWNESSSLEYLLEYFEELKDFYRKAAENDEGIITFIS